jgi:hypothetical protein
MNLASVASTAHSPHSPVVARSRTVASLVDEVEVDARVGEMGWPLPKNPSTINSLLQVASNKQNPFEDKILPFRLCYSASLKCEHLPGGRC